MKSWVEVKRAELALSNLRYYWILWLLGLVVALAAANFQRAPGYMDADYYYVNGLRLASGSGSTEPFLWNYLGDPQGLPHPAFTYWMPLAAILASLGVIRQRSTDFYGARLGAILLAASCHQSPPRWPVSFRAARSRSARRDAGGFSGFYLVYLTTTDTFGICMVLGAAWLLVVGWVRHQVLSSAIKSICQPGNHWRSGSSRV
jgi:hypothetical protein